MSQERAAPATKGVTVKLLTTVDLGPEIEGMAGRQLRMRRVTIEMESLRTTARGWAGPRTEKLCIGLRTEDRSRQWRSLSILSGKPGSRPGKAFSRTPGMGKELR